MIAVIFEGREEMEVSEVPRPECGEGEVLLQIAACGICGGDARSYFQGDANTGTRRIPGHEMVGIVAETRNPDYRAGERIALAADVHCGECWFCQRELFNLCDNHRVLGKHMNGGLADYMLLTQKILRYGIVNRVPESLSLLHAGVSEPLCSVLATHDDLRIEAGETVVVVGSGPMGILHLELLRARGARVIMMARTHSRLDRARDDFGAEHIVATSDGHPVEQIRSLTDGRGADVAIIAAPSPEAVTQSVWLVRKRGRIGLFGGLPVARRDAPIDINRVHYGEISMIGNFSYHPSYHRKALDLLSSGGVPCDKLITKYPIEQTKQALHDIREGNVLKAVVVPNGGKLV